MQSRQVLLIGWDAADWKVIHPLMDAGRMPHLRRLVERGVMGQIATLNPPLSPMLWTSIATGKRPFQHGIHGFVEPTTDGRNIQPVTNLSRRCKAVWNILTQSGLRSVVVGWWPSHPAEPIHGVMVSDHYHRARGPLSQGWPMLDGTVHPASLSETLGELRLHPEELAGEMVEPFVPLARKIDQSKDRRLMQVGTTLCECVSIHSAATWLLDHEDWDFFAVYYDAIDHFSHGFMRYHPPRREQIPEHDFELYQNVVRIAYQFHDQMLGTLLGKIGEDTTVMLISDHGFHPDHLRPNVIPDHPTGPAIEHRDFGVLAMAGPGIRKDELVHGASLLDVTPTLLALFGLPVGSDMDGRVLTGAFESPPEVRSIASWEDVAGEDGRHPPHTQIDPVAAQEALQQLVALGYIAPPDEDGGKAVSGALAEMNYNLAVSYQDADRHVEAADLLRALRRGDPDEQRYAVSLFVSCQALGLGAEMREILEDLDGRRRELFQEAQRKMAEFRAVVEQRAKERNKSEDEKAAESGPLLTQEERKELSRWRNLVRFQPPVVDYLRAQVLAKEGWHGKALESLERVTEAHLARPGLFLQTADLYRQMGQWDDAEKTYAKALAIDPDNPHAHLGMARMAFRKRDFSAAAQSSLECIQRLYHYPLAHFFLGMALARLEEYERAAEAFRVAISLNPNFPQAHLRLAVLLQRHLSDPQGAEEHLRWFRELRAQRKLATEAAPSGLAVRERTPQKTTFSAALPELTDEIVVISGLPRAGTSMVMQMVSAGGLEIVSDGARQPDENNPRGYFEFESVKHLAEDADWLETAKGRAIKIVAPLLPHLPAGLRYRVIFVHRDLDEILMSQARMLGSQEDDSGRRLRLTNEYARLVDKVLALLSESANVVLLQLDHSKVLKNPHAAAETIDRFLGGRLSVPAMAGAVEPLLHRQHARA